MRTHLLYLLLQVLNTALLFVNRKLFEMLQSFRILFLKIALKNLKNQENLKKSINRMHLVRNLKTIYFNTFTVDYEYFD